MYPYELLLSLCVCVVLPVLIVWLISRVRKNETDRKAEIILKSIEAGMPIDPSIFKKPQSRQKTMKENLLERLTGACVTSFMGVAFLVSGIVFHGKPIKTFFFEPTYLIITGSILLGIGIALLVVFFTGKKMLANEIEAEEKNLTDNN